MFGFACKDNKIVDGIREKDVFYVYKLVRKYKKHIFRNINVEDKDLIFSDLILAVLEYIENNEELDLAKLIDVYVDKINKDTLKRNGLELYNDVDILKYVAKQWENKRYNNSEFCEVFNCIVNSEVSEAGNEPCYCVITLEGDNIHVKEFANDFSIFYDGEFYGHNTTYNYVDKAEIKRNASDQLIGARIHFKDNFDFYICAQTCIDSKNIENLGKIAREHSVALSV